MGIEKDQIQRMHRDIHGKPGVYVGHFSAKSQRDTFVDTSGWGKGQLLVNGFNVGRYWPSARPQVSMLTAIFVY